MKRTKTPVMDRLPEAYIPDEQIPAYHASIVRQVRECFRAWQIRRGFAPDVPRYNFKTKKSTKRP